MNESIGGQFRPGIYCFCLFFKNVKKYFFKNTFENTY